MPLDGCAKRCISILAYRSFCRLDLGQGAGSLHLFEERHGRVRESDASGDTPRGSLRNHALAQLIGTNHGPTGFPYHELAETADHSMLRLKTRRLS
jgi:hypothetical protein